MAPVERPGRTAAAEENETCTETVAEEAAAAEDAPLSPIAGEPRTPSSNVAMKRLFTPRNYTKSKTFDNYNDEFFRE
jgi:hypothetical protein